MPYLLLSKGDFNYVLRGLPENLSLKDPSTMGEATLDEMIGISNSLSFANKDGNIEGKTNVGDGNGDQRNDGEGNDEERRNDSEQGNTGNENEQQRETMNGERKDEERRNDSEQGNIGNENEEQRETMKGEGNGAQRENDGEQSTGNAGEKEQTRKKRKRTKKKTGNNKRKDKQKKRKAAYEKCVAFLCQEPAVKQDRKLDWVQCDVCQVWYHWDCVGTRQEPKGRFNCGCNNTYFTPG